MQLANLSGPFRGCLYYALLGLPQATGLAGGYDFSAEEVLISSDFPSMGVQKSLMLGFSYFTAGALLIFALHPLMGKIKK